MKGINGLKNEMCGMGVVLNPDSIYCILSFIWTKKRAGYCETAVQVVTIIETMLEYSIRYVLLRHWWFWEGNSC